MRSRLEVHSLKQMRHFNEGLKCDCIFDATNYAHSVIAKRRWRFYCALIWRDYLIGFPGIVLSAAVRLSCPFEMRRGFRISSPRTGTLIPFCTAVDEALDLLARGDPIRFKRVQTEIRSIVNAPAIDGSAYGPQLRVCNVDVRCFACFADPENPQAAPLLLASALVRGSTVGHLARRGILRTRRNRVRFDRLCFEEPRKFLRRCGMTKTPYDPECLITLTPGAYLKKTLKEVRGAYKGDPVAEASEWEKARTHQEIEPQN